MPYKNREDKLAAQRRSYAKHREKVIADVTRRKRTVYGSVCRNCGGPTWGTGPNHHYQWCGKPDCKSFQMQVMYQERRHGVDWKHVLSLARRKGKYKGFCTCGWQSNLLGSPDSVQIAYKLHTNLVEREAKRPSDGS